MTIKDIPVQEAKSSSESSIPVVPALDDSVSKYNAAAKQAKEAEATMKKLGPELLKQGVECVISENCEHSSSPISSVKLEDPKGAQIMVTLKKQATKFDSARVKTWFSTVTDKQGKPVDPNKYFEWELKAEFNSKVLMHNGKFSQNRFDKFQAAMQVVCEELGLAENPLTFSKALVAKPEFHERRYEELPFETNLELQSIVPCVAALKPLEG